MYSGRRLFDAFGTVLVSGAGGALLVVPQGKYFLSIKEWLSRSFSSFHIYLSRKAGK